MSVFMSHDTRKWFNWAVACVQTLPSWWIDFGAQCVILWRSSFFSFFPVFVCAIELQLVINMHINFHVYCKPNDREHFMLISMPFGSGLPIRFIFEQTRTSINANFYTNFRILPELQSIYCPESEMLISSAKMK